MKAGDHVRTKAALTGIAQGPSKKHGDGRPCEIPAGAVCEVFDVERTSGWLTLHYELEASGPREPYRCEAVAFPEQVEPAARPPLPPIIPKGAPTSNE